MSADFVGLNPLLILFQAIGVILRTNFSKSMQKVNRAITLFVLICASMGSLFAQGVHSKQIYLWDVTLSMRDNGIWEQVKDQMITSLREVRDKDTEVIVIPFQDDTYPEQRVQVGDASALEALCQWIDEYQIPMPKGGHGTNICRALSRAEDFIFKEDIDCVFLLTDGTHEPKNPAMAEKFPVGCLTEYLENRWCAFATELDAYLIYYHLLGNSDLQIEEVTEATCRALSIQPGDGTPDRLHYITPQVQKIVKDKSWLAQRNLDIPMTTSLPKDFQALCEMDAELVSADGTSSSPLNADYQGANLACELSEANIAWLNQKCPPKVEEESYPLLIRLTLRAPEDLLVALTAESLPVEFHHYEQRWFDVKVIPKEAP